MAYISNFKYYENDGLGQGDENWGSYQYVTLADIVNNFMLMYVGNHELINNIDRYKVLFHAKRAIQELNYDAMREVKVLQQSLDDRIRLVLPSDYVNYVRISMYEDGSLRPLVENMQINYSRSYLQDHEAKILFDQNGDILEGTSEVDYKRIKGLDKSMYLGEGLMNGCEGYCDDGHWYFERVIGARYGLNTETANINPTFRIDKRTGVINFSSEMSGKEVVIEYISDGLEMGNDSEVVVNKLAEEFIYAYTKYMILSTKLGVQEYIVRRAQKEKSAMYRNAKLRMSNIHPSRLLMSLRGQNKWIK
ncbi:MAG: hypothetical protein CBB97_13560 [Candidatus Endolissoclinum sp. TMED37]|nr:MAG: hypothetical protein CBB97_13560 [Candidatus Endolissoclinum sp. TMED37]|tara:strand:- start:999 stop:1916 length:918 start_codon:yes stop_codon:yes gene_type:complete